MKKYKFTELLQNEIKIKRLFKNLGVSYNPSGRISQYFSYLNKIEEKRNLNKHTFSKFIERDKAKFYFSQFYVLELSNIFNAINDSKIEKPLLRNKLRLMSKGTFLLSQERKNNSIARNTTFEMSLLAFFKKLKLKSTLQDPNPDVRLHTKMFTYDIECKRPYSLKSLEKNIKEAYDQLRKSPNIPTIALSLEHIILGNDLILHTQNNASALKYLDNLLFTFSQKNKQMLDKMFLNESCIVLYYLSCLTGFEDKNLPMANATYIVGNIYNFGPDLSSKLLEDLQKIKS